MIVKILFINPFIDSFIHSDFLGKTIFLSLFLLSICNWTVLVYQFRLSYFVRKKAEHTLLEFQGVKGNLLQWELTSSSHPFAVIFQVLKKQTLNLLNKNRRFGTNSKDSEKQAFLSPTDIDFVESQLMSTVIDQTRMLDKHLYILATIAGVAPLVGLLGTVWGILVTFADPGHLTGNSQAMLGGLSLALTTTVLGLFNAIPALLGYNWLRNGISHLQSDMEKFAIELLALVELQYRKVDLQ